MIFGRSVGQPPHERVTTPLFMGEEIETTVGQVRFVAPATSDDVHLGEAEGASGTCKTHRMKLTGQLGSPRLLCVQLDISNPPEVAW